jgi:apolipoprotein N-acyltransferase
LSHGGASGDKEALRFFPAHIPFGDQAVSLAPPVSKTATRLATRTQAHSHGTATAIGRGVLSGLLLVLAFPPADRPLLAWFALVPLLTLLDSTLPRRLVYASAWAGGLVFWLVSLVWMWELHPSAWMAWLALAIYQSIYWPIFFALARGITLACRAPAVLAVPTAWVACEYIQNHALSGFPWYYLAHSQYRLTLLIQISDLTGAWGVSFAVAMLNAWIALGVSRLRKARATTAHERRSFLRQTVAVALLGALTLGYGVVRIGQARFEPGPSVLLLQSNLRQVLKNSLDPRRIVEIYRNLIQEGLNRSEGQGRSIDLTVWPETSYPYGFTRIAPGLSAQHVSAAGKTLIPGTNADDWYDRREATTQELRRWSEAIGGPMLVGSTLFEFDASGARRANAAVWIDSRASDTTIYRKMHLVPFGEYIPFPNALPWIARLAPYDERNLPRLKPGKGPFWFNDGRFIYAPVICFEDTLPHVARRFFREAPRGHEPDVLVNISNDGWFNGSAEHDMHLASGVFRAVENRVPIVRAANMGYTASIDGDGRVQEILPKATEGALVTNVRLDPRVALYSQMGDWFPQICTIAVFLLILASRIRFILPGRIHRSQCPETA